MNFEKYFYKNITSEWEKQYINYKVRYLKFLAFIKFNKFFFTGIEKNANQIEQ